MTTRRAPTAPRAPRSSTTTIRAGQSGAGAPSRSPRWHDVDDVTVVIPAAGRVKEGLLPMSGRLNSAMVPVAGKPVVYWTLRYLTGLGISRFVVAVRQRGEFLEDFVRACFPDLARLDFVVPDRDGGLGYTVATAAARVDTGRVLVVLGDTHFAFAPSLWRRRARAGRAVVPSGSFVLAAPVPDCERWCMATVVRGHATDFVDKPAACPPDRRALVGVYGFHDARLLARVAATATAPLRRSTRTRTIVEMSAILRAYRAHVPLAVHPPGQWLDCGNPDNLASSHRRLLAARAFNQIAIDETVGVFHKRSPHTEAGRRKLRDEIAYYRRLPATTAVLFPRLVAADTRRGREHLALEYYGYPNLSEVWLYENLPTTTWERVLHHLRDLVGGALTGPPVALAGGVHRAMYVDKTTERLGLLARSTRASGPRRDLAVLLDPRRGPRVNGRPCPSITDIVVAVETALPRLRGDGTGGVIHGDLGFANILYDLRAHVVKLVDPRGRFGRAGIHGDPRYDVAKLGHSVWGGYDFLVSDLFRVSATGADVDLAIFRRPEHREVETVFRRLFFRGPRAFDEGLTDLVTGLLFLTMPPLHYDAPRRQLAMLARGFEILAAVLAGRRPDGKVRP